MRNIFLLLAIIFCLISCNENQTSTSNAKLCKPIDQYESERFIQDSFGCNGERYRMNKQGILRFSEFKGCRINDFEDNFGKPEQVQMKSEETKEYTYWLTCKWEQSNNSIRNKDAMLLFVEVDRSGIIKDVSVILP